jgi:hypothetical protein
LRSYLREARAALRLPLDDETLAAVDRLERAALPAVGRPESESAAS